MHVDLVQVNIVTWTGDMYFYNMYFLIWQGMKILPVSLL